MNKLKLSTRLTLGFGVLALLIAFTAGMALARLPHIESAFHKVTDERIPRVAALNEVKGNLNQIGVSMRNMAIMSDAAERKKEVMGRLTGTTEVSKADTKKVKKLLGR